MSHLVFVFGTLKEGYPNFRINKGTRVPGGFATAERLPFYLVGERFSPWMINDPGHGEQVIGQVFQVDDAVLEQMDALERTTIPDGYKRRWIAVTPISRPGASPLDVYAYLKEPHQLAHAQIRAGPIAEYTLEHAAMYKPHPHLARIEIEVRNVIFIAGRGTVVVGHVRAGTARAGQLTVPIALGDAPGRRLEVSAVERLSSMEARGQGVGVVFHDPPNLNDLKSALPPGSILELREPGGSGSRLD